MSTEFPLLKDSRLSLESGVACLTFDRNDLRNALTGTLLVDDLLSTLEWIRTTPEVCVLVLTGAGSAFSSGGNVKEMRDRDSAHRDGPFGGSVAEVQHKYRTGIQRMPLAMERAEVPVIAAVNGPAIGAGFDLACMCDLRLASTEARFGETFLNLGIIPGDGGAWFLPRLVGAQRAAELAFTGRVIDAGEALELGLLLEVLEPDQLLDGAMSLARQIASKPPGAIRMTKRLLKAGQSQPLESFLELCALYQGICHNTEDHREAVAAFLERRSPQYHGR